MIWNMIVDHIPWQVYAGLAVVVVGLLLWFASPIILPIWHLIPLPARVAFAGVFAGFLAYIAGRTTGRKNAEDEERQRNVEALQKRTEVDRDVSNMSKKEVDDKLRDRWTRDEP